MFILQFKFKVCLLVQSQSTDINVCLKAHMAPNWFNNDTVWTKIVDMVLCFELVHADKRIYTNFDVYLYA